MFGVRPQWRDVMTVRVFRFKLCSLDLMAVATSIPEFSGQTIKVIHRASLLPILGDQTELLPRCHLVPLLPPPP